MSWLRRIVTITIVAQFLEFPFPLRAIVRKSRCPQRRRHQNDAVSAHVKHFDSSFCHLPHNKRIQAQRSKKTGPIGETRVGSQILAGEWGTPTGKSHLDVLLVRVFVILYCGNCLLHLAKNHIQMLIVCLLRTWKGAKPCKFRKTVSGLATGITTRRRLRLFRDTTHPRAHTCTNRFPGQGRRHLTPRHARAAAAKGRPGELEGGNELSTREGPYMQLPAELTVAAHLHVDALIEGQTEKIEGLVHITSALARHRHTGQPEDGPSGAGASRTARRHTSAWRTEDGRHGGAGEQVSSLHWQRCFVTLAGHLFVCICVI